MQITWQVESEDVARLDRLLSEHGGRTFVSVRRERNIVNRPTAVPDRGRCWLVHLGCLLTTQQRSGPSSRVQALLSAKPFDLALDRCAGKEDTRKYILETLTAFGGLRRTKIIADFAAANLGMLDSGGWSQLEEQLGRLVAETDPKIERGVAREIAARFRGFGPKQSRNFLQWLGLTQYEIPLDSRVVRWLSANGFPVKLSGEGLSDPGYYELLLDGVQALCAAAEMLPCEFDALVFSSYDPEWSDQNVF